MEQVVATVERVSRALAVIAGAILVFITGSVVADVAFRTLRGQGLPQVVEYSEVLLVALIFLSFAETQRKRGHVGIELVAVRLPERIRVAVEFVGMVVVIAVLIPVTWESATLAFESYVQGEFRFGLVRTPVWPSRAAITIGLVALIGQLVAQLGTALVNVRRTGPTQIW